MAAEYTNPTVQTVDGGQPVLFTSTVIPGVQNLIFKQNGDAVILLASQVNRSSCCCNSATYYSIYKVEVNANIAIPTGGTVEQIGLAITIEGEPAVQSYMYSTPAAVEQYNNVSTSILVPVPDICNCSSISVRSLMAPGTEILVSNPNIVIKPAGVQRAN